MVAFKGREHQSMGNKAEKFHWTSSCSQEGNFLSKLTSFMRKVENRFAQIVFHDEVQTRAV